MSSTSPGLHPAPDNKRKKCNQGHKCLIMINPRKSTIKHFIKDKWRHIIREPGPTWTHATSTKRGSLATSSSHCNWLLLRTSRSGSTPFRPTTDYYPLLTPLSRELFLCQQHGLRAHLTTRLPTAWCDASFVFSLFFCFFRTITFRSNRQSSD